MLKLQMTVQSLVHAYQSLHLVHFFIYILTRTEVNVIPQSLNFATTHECENRYILYLLAAITAAIDRKLFLCISIASKLG